MSEIKTNEEIFDEMFEEITRLENGIATKDAELARLREALEKIAKPEMPVNALVLMKIAQEALKSNDS